MFDNLQERFERAFKVLKGHGQITEVNVGETLKEVRKALLDADVDYKTAKDFIKKIKEKALGQKVLTALKPGQLLIKITQEELTELMGKAAAPFELKSKPTVVLLAGLQGAGKTTHAGKLGKYIKDKGKKTLLVACDVYRRVVHAEAPAAEGVEQRHDLRVREHGGERGAVRLAPAEHVLRRLQPAELVLCRIHGGWK